MAKTLTHYINDIVNVETKHKLDASFEMLLHIDSISNYFKVKETSDKAEILTNTFGLLQGLFVGVDSLYNLVLSITKHKYYININQNPFLRQLKFVRNDVVGHPTNRKYGTNGIGYTKINLESLTIDYLSYEVFRFRRGELKQKIQVINFDKLIDAYQIEKDIIINQLVAYINKDYTKVNFSSELRDFYLNINQRKIDSLRTSFIATYSNYVQHRFLWRLKLLELTLGWQEASINIMELIIYIQKQLAIKLEVISLDMENKPSKKISLPEPKAIRKFRTILRKRPGLVSYLESLNDHNNPFYENDLENLIDKINDKDVLEILKYLQNIEDNEKVFLIGSVLKKYNN